MLAFPDRISVVRPASRMRLCAGRDSSRASGLLVRALSLDLMPNHTTFRWTWLDHLLSALVTKRCQLSVGRSSALVKKAKTILSSARAVSHWLRQDPAMPTALLQASPLPDGLVEASKLPFPSPSLPFVDQGAGRPQAHHTRTSRLSALRPDCGRGLRPSCVTPLC